MAWDSNADITSVFQDFGYTPTQAEIDALRPSFGEGFGEGVSMSAVGQYVNFQNQIKKFEANDPLTALQTRMNNIIDQNTSSVQNLEGQLQSVLTSAPQLFGNMTPDQIQTYLAPLKTSFDQQIASIQGISASRGTAASSTEANALAETNQQFQQGVLQTGLNIGLTSQQNRAQALKDQINNLFTQTGQAMGISGQAAGQKSAQDLAESNLIGSLPSLLNAQSAQMAAFNKALNPDTGGFQNTFNQVTGDISQGLGLLGQVGNLATGGLLFTGNKAGSPTVPTVASATPPPSPNLSLLQGAPGTAAAYGLGSAGSADSLAATGSLFA